MNPLARRHGVRQSRIEDEVVVYDILADQAHCLHPLTAQVWELADGTRSVAQIAAAARLARPDLEDEDVWAALDGLADAGLLESRAAPPAGERQLSRRRLIRGLAAASLGIVAVTTITTPAAAVNGVSGQESVGKDEEQLSKEVATKEMCQKEGCKETFDKEGSPKEGDKEALEKEQQAKESAKP